MDISPEAQKATEDTLACIKKWSQGLTTKQQLEFLDKVLDTLEIQYGELVEKEEHE